MTVDRVFNNWTLGTLCPWSSLLVWWTMAAVEFVTMNIPIPLISDDYVLEAIGAGLSIMIDQHKKLDLSFTDPTMSEHVRLTMGDHICELVGNNDELFSLVYDQAIDQLDIVLSTYWIELELFAEQLDHIADIMMFWYPGLIRLCVREKEMVTLGDTQLFIS